jgi:hypothetical protein
MQKYDNKTVSLNVFMTDGFIRESQEKKGWSRHVWTERNKKQMANEIFI